MNKSIMIIPAPAVKRQLCGVIFSRIMSRGKLELAAAQLLEFSAADVKSLTALVPQAEELLPVNSGASMIAVFEGENASEILPQLAADIEQSLSCRLITAAAGNSRFLQALALIADRKNLLTQAPAAGEERTLLIIKPENFRQPSVRPGAVIDMLMSLDLKWVGCKVHGMSIDEALEFYGPVRQALRSKLGSKIGKQALETIEKEFNFTFDTAEAAKIVETAGNGFADDQFEQIVEFMAGKRPAEVDPADYAKPAGAKCMVLIFDGVDAVAKIRTILGPTNPAQASGGTVRYDFGTNIMVNASHASDSQESYARESAIVKVNENKLSEILKNR